MQTILSITIFALVAGAAVDSATIIAGDKSVAKRDLWNALAKVSGHMAAGVQNYGAQPSGWDQSGPESRIAVPDQHQGGQATGPSAEQYRASSHAVHEWHQEQDQSSSEWQPRHHTFSSHTKEASKEQQHHVEIHDEGHGGKHEKEQEHHHHHHHHVKVIEVPKPYTVHVEKPYVVYVKKPVIVEKHIPLKLTIKKKGGHH